MVHQVRKIPWPGGYWPTMFDSINDRVSTFALSILAYSIRDGFCSGIKIGPKITVLRENTPKLLVFHLVHWKIGYPEKLV